MGEEPTVRYCGNSHSKRRRRKSSEYSGTSRLELSKKRGAPGKRRYGPSRRWDDSPSRSDCPSRRWEKSLTRKDDTRSEITMRSNRPRRDPYSVPRGYLLLVSDILCGILVKNSALGNNIPPYDYSLSDTNLYSGFAEYFFFKRRNPYVILSQSTPESITSVVDFINAQASSRHVTTLSESSPELQPPDASSCHITLSKWSPELQPPDASPGTSYDTHSYGITKLFPSKFPARKRNKQTSALPSNGANHQWVEQHHEVDDYLTSNLQDSVSNSWGIDDLNQRKQSFGMGRSRTWRYCRFLKSNRLCKPTKYPARSFERISWGNGAKLPVALGRGIRPGPSLMSIRQPRKKAGYYDLGHLGPEIQENLSRPGNNCNSEFDM